MEDVAVSILSDIDCQLGEGPTFDAAADALFWFDIVSCRLMEMRWSDRATTVHDLPFMASAIAAVDAGRQALVTETGIHLRDRRTGALSLIQPIEADDPATRSNDSRVHPSGAFWIGTMGKKAGREAGAIYWYRGGELKPLFPRISIPNSICFSPDGSTAFFADTAVNRLWRVDCDPATGLPSGEPRLFLDHKGVAGGIDGSVMDADGLLWNARWGAGALDCYDGNGTRLRRIDIPARQSTCPAFVGAAGDRIVVTSAWQGMDAATREADPHAGKTFLVELDVRGRHDAALLI